MKKNVVFNFANRIKIIEFDCIVLRRIYRKWVNFIGKPSIINNILSTDLMSNRPLCKPIFISRFGPPLSQDRIIIRREFIEI